MLEFVVQLRSAGSYWTRWDSSDNRHGFNVASDHGPGSDHSSTPNSNARKDQRARGYPRIVLDHDRCSSVGVCIALRVMVECEDHRIASNVDTLSNPYGCTTAVKNAAAVNHRIAANAHGPLPDTAAKKFNACKDVGSLRNIEVQPSQWQADYCKRNMGDNPIEQG
jgi:hypothetical protein